MKKRKSHLIAPELFRELQEDNAQSLHTQPPNATAKKFNQMCEPAYSQRKHQPNPHPLNIKIKSVFEERNDPSMNCATFISRRFGN